MAGAFSLFLGLLGLGAAGAVSAGQNAKIKKADYQYGEEHGGASAARPTTYVNGLHTS